MEKIEKRKSPDMTSIVNKNLTRLHKVKALVESRKCNSLAEMRNEVTGSSKLFTQLVNKSILIKVDNTYTWNTKVPVTHRLAHTLTVEVRKVHMQGKHLKVTKPFKAKKPRKEVKNTNKGTREFSLLWGLVNIKY